MEWRITLENINDVAKSFWNKYEDRRVFAFHGQVGAGKTTFIHALCDAKAVTDAVGSPTFAIINEYEYIGKNNEKTKLFHLDLYRIKDEAEALQAGVDDVLNSGYTCLVEWPEKVPGLFDASAVHAQLEWLNTETRLLKIDDK
jgi:tRNA threonylcarbamoyladenosine biosynthesis protein TsaE